MPHTSDFSFLDYLSKNNYISSSQNHYLQERIKLGYALHEVIRNFLGDEEILQHKCSYYGVTRVKLSELEIDSFAAFLIPEQLATKYNLIPFKINKGRLCVAMADPVDRRAMEDVELYSGYKTEPYLATPEEIKVAIREFYTIQQSQGDITDDYQGSLNVWKIEENVVAGNEGSVVRLVDSLFNQAVREMASDIHWEPGEESFKVRFRIDGRLELKTILSSTFARSVTARLKVMAGMDVTERRRPQDGRIVLDLLGKKIDVRVSTFNTVYGEKVVARILDYETAQLSLAELGMRKDVEEGARKLLLQPHGLILVAGPTGSGKTTTLYALLRELQAESLNIVSIEDPVEYRLPGLNQAQVNTKIGLDFAQGLRAILRQDPDIIMVGEIRDRETAKIATAAALTGHLVLTTVHTNTAAEALARMLEMDIEPYIVAASVCGVIAQRLVRRLCPFCREQKPVPLVLKHAFNWEGIDYIYGPGRCSRCRGTGYKGRIGIHEYLHYDYRIKELVLNKGSALEIEKLARSLNIPSLKEDALIKVAEGWTSLEEVIGLIEGV
ncbi:MAG: type II/IV secretion system protein [Peptococcaceae bacterium]|nr:type II/IV secretion system protein [Peptococcaceae bacterium]